VLDHDQRVALVAQAEQLLDVVEVQACGGFVEDVERAAGGTLEAQGLADLAGPADSRADRGVPETLVTER
jgi:hypothetical protein